MNCKNLIYVFADQWRREATGRYNKEFITPNFDKFMSESFVFDRAYSTSPVCSPHRACLLSGKYPLSNGVFTNCKTGINMGLDENDVCLGDVLKTAGYKTAYIGKWHLDNPDVNTGEDKNTKAHGWDAFTPVGKKRHGFDFWYSYGADDCHMTPHYWKDSKEMIQINEWSPQHETKVAIDFLKNTQDKFALVLSYNPPHNPYNLTPKKYTELYKDISKKENVISGKLKHFTGENTDIDDITDILKGYYGAVSGIDDCFGQIISYLKESGRYDDTLIVLSADHGDMLGSHGLIGKYVWYEESVGIPLAFGGAGITPGESDALIGSVDHTPTVLDLMGQKTPKAMQGKSFKTVIEGEKEGVYDSLYLGGYVNKAENMLLMDNPFSYGWRCVVSKRYKLAVHNGFGINEPKRSYLYDLSNDPLEMSPIDNPKIEQELKKQLDDWLIKLKDPFKKKL